MPDAGKRLGEQVVNSFTTKNVNSGVSPLKILWLICVGCYSFRSCQFYNNSSPLLSQSKPTATPNIKHLTTPGKLCRTADATHQPGEEECGSEEEEGVPPPGTGRCSHVCLKCKIVHRHEVDMIRHMTAQVVQFVSKLQ